MKDATFEHADNETCLNQVREVYETSYYAQTLRHYYYKLLSSGALRLLPIENSGDQAYKFLSRLLVKAREDGRLPWSAIIDTGRRSFPHWSYTSLESYIQAESSSGFILDPWRGQERRIEVWVEKDAMADQVNRVVDDLRIPVYVAKGYGSATIKNNTRERYGDGSSWVLLYLGDFDPTGVDIERELKDKLAEYGAYPEIKRVTLTYEDTFTLPSFAALDLKEKDPRTKRFKDTYPGSKGYELDVLSTEEVQERLLHAISPYMDEGAFKAAERLEYVIREEASKRLKNAMSDFAQTILRRGAPGCTLPLSEQLQYLMESKS